MKLERYDPHPQGLPRHEPACEGDRGGCHQKLRVTPAMAACVTDKLWEIGDIAKLVKDAEAPAKKREPYEKRVGD